MYIFRRSSSDGESHKKKASAPAVNPRPQHRQKTQPDVPPGRYPKRTQVDEFTGFSLYWFQWVIHHIHQDNAPICSKNFSTFNLCYFSQGPSQEVVSEMAAVESLKKYNASAEPGLEVSMLFMTKLRW